MGIPKMKLYRLEKGYSPLNDTDLQTIDADEIYPVVEKSVLLDSHEQLVGVTFRDMEAVVAKAQRQVEVAMDGDSNRTEWVKCHNWLLGKGQMAVSALAGEKYVPIEPSAWRANFSNVDEVVETDGRRERRKYPAVQVEFGHTAATAVEGNAISGARIEYVEFTASVDEIKEEAGKDSPSLMTRHGNVYDGTAGGRLGVVDGTGYSWARDENGEPLKAEGNRGFKAKIYPLRNVTAGTADGCDFSMGTDGKFTVTGCDDWILTQTDDRRPRLFVREDGVWIQMEEGEQYVSALNVGADGRFSLSFQLSPAYFAVDGEPLYPSVVYVRYNEEDDVLGDVLVPDYLEYAGGEPTGGTGRLEGKPRTDYAVKRTCRIASADATGEDLAMTATGDDAVGILMQGIELDSGTIRVYLHGRLACATDGSQPEIEGYSAAFNSGVLTVNHPSGEEVTQVMVAYDVLNTFGEGGWSGGFRVCAYEKTRYAKVFASSFRNWIADHLNNNPDIFVGKTKYPGTEDDEKVQIAYADGGFTIDHRSGSVEFQGGVEQVSREDVLNGFSEADAETAASDEEVLSQAVVRVCAKFAYYDGLVDATHALLRLVSVGAGAYVYCPLEDPENEDIRGRRWIVRNDNRMPTTFYDGNEYLPMPVNEVDSPCEKWSPWAVSSGRVLQMSFAKGRRVAVSDGFERPPLSSGDGIGSDAEQRAVLAWSFSWGGDTSFVESPAEGSVKFDVVSKWNRGATAWDLEKCFVVVDGVELKIGDAVFDKDKTVADNVSARAGAVFRTDGDCPYDIVFTVGERVLLVSRRDK